jgi:hypothetical protein
MWAGELYSVSMNSIQAVMYPTVAETSSSYLTCCWLEKAATITNKGELLIHKLPRALLMIRETYRTQTPPGFLH